MNELYSYVDADQGRFADKVEKENNSLQINLRTAIEDICEIACPINKNRWHKLESKMSEMVTIWSAFRKLEYNDARSSNDFAFNKGIYVTAGLLGASLVISNILDEEMRIAENGGFDYSFKPIADLSRFGYAREFCINIDGINLGDFPTSKPAKQPVMPYFQYLLKGSYGNVAYGNADTIKNILEQNQQYPMDQYPALTERAVRLLSYRLLGLMGLTGREMNQIIGNDQHSYYAETMVASDRLSACVQAVRREVYRILFDPKHEEYAKLKDLLVDYLDKNNGKRVLITLSVLGADDDESLFNLYRHAMKSIAEGTEIELYSLVADSIKMLIDNAASARHILDIDDIPAILAEEHGLNPGKTSPTISNFSQTVAEIFSRSAQNRYEINVQSVNWDGLLMPQSANVVFDKANPQTFTFNLTFSNKLGEITRIHIDFDTKNGSMDWNFLPDPMKLDVYPNNEDAEMLKRSVLFAAYSTLNYIQEELQRQNSISDKRELDLPVKTNGNLKLKEHYTDPVYQLRKKVKRENGRTRGSDSIVMDLGEIIPEKVVRNIVIMPGEKALKRLSFTDREIIEQAINSYNENGAGAQFSRLRSISSTDPLYRLRINCHAPNGARVLLKEAASSNGIRTFEVVDISYRKDSYRWNTL